MEEYSRSFYEHQSGGSRRSAELVVPLVLAEVSPVRSVVDVGCGVGTWLSVFLEHGVEQVLGIDGPYVHTDDLLIAADRFLARDLTRPLDVSDHFDLAISLEVAEHLDGRCADGFVAELCELADTVVFSAAVPGQRGQHHVNEQWPSYWIPKFEAHGFGVSDPLRPILWDLEEVAIWYRQNTLVFRRGVDSAPVLDMVHPEFLAGAVRYASEPGLRLVPGIVTGAIGRAVENRRR